MKIKGIVESISSRLIEGWVVVYKNKDEIVQSPKIELKVNGRTVAITFAVRQISYNSIISNHCGFKFLIKDLFNYLNKDDVVTISTYDEDIPIYKSGLSFKSKTNGNYNVEDLFNKLNKGYTFDINGELKLALKENNQLRKQTIKLYSELRTLFNECFSYKLFACYGTLLGIGRDGNFIANDGNFDCAYFSNKNKKDKIIDEFKTISKTLIKKEYILKVFNSHIQVSKSDCNANINIYCTWFNEGLQFLLSFDYIGEEFRNENNTFEIEESTLFGEKVYIPKEYKSVLKQIYGSKWNIPDFGFEWGHLNKKNIFLTYNDVNEIYWEQHYLNVKKQKPSSFCSLVSNFVTVKYLIIDIGCGSARDSFEFANQGHEVIGLDKSEQAILFANSVIKEDNYKNIKFYKADISDINSMSKLFERFKEEAMKKQMKIIYYSRFFLHSIDEDNQNKLLKAISNFVHKGDIFAAEFRTKEDEKRQKIYSDHYRRFIDEKEILEQLKETCNMDNLLLFQKGTGFSIYKDEDPFLARIIVRKD